MFQILSGEPPELRVDSEHTAPQALFDFLAFLNDRHFAREFPIWTQQRLGSHFDLKREV